MAIRTTPPDEIERINERLESESRMQIRDRDSYDLAFSDLLKTPEKELSPKQKKLRDMAFGEYKKSHPDVSKDRLFKEARGKDLKRDRRQTAKGIVTTIKDYKKKGASKVDLKGYDTARQKIKKDILRRRTFTIPARIKGRIVYSIKTSVVVMGKRHVRFRDSKGRFASGKLR